MARTSVGASASSKMRRSKMENMSRIRKQKEIFLNTLAAAEKSVFASMNDYQNLTFAHLLNTFGALSQFWLIKERRGGTPNVTISAQ